MEVRHLAPSRKIEWDYFPWPTFAETFPELPEAKAANTSLFSSWGELDRAVLESDVLLIGTWQAYQEVARLAWKSGKVVIQHRDIGGMDNYVFDVDLLAVRGPWESGALRARGISLKRPPAAVGCVQFDNAAPGNARLSRSELFTKYGLDDSKETALVLSNGPGTHSIPYRAKTRRLFDEILRTGRFNVICKPHPSEYSRFKYSKPYGSSDKMSWDHYSQGIAVCDPEDGYDVLRHCDVIVARQSTMFLETPLVQKPVLFVDFPELWLPADLDDERLKKWHPPPRFTPPSRRPFHPMGIMGEGYLKIPDPEMQGMFKRSYQSVMGPGGVWGLIPDYIGTEVTIEEMAEVLDAGAYRFDDAEAYDEYAREYCVANDGETYKRVADLVESIPRDAELWRKVRRSQRFGPVVRSWFQVRNGLGRARKIAGRLKGALYGRLSTGPARDGRNLK